MVPHPEGIRYRFGRERKDTNQNTCLQGFNPSFYYICNYSMSVLNTDGYSPYTH